MKFEKNRITSLIFLPVLVLIFFSGNAFAQKDTVYRKKNFFQRLDSVTQWKVANGKATFTPYVAPSYSPEMQFMLSAGGLVTFKLKPESPLLSRSSIPFFDSLQYQ